MQNRVKFEILREVGDLVITDRAMARKDHIVLHHSATDVGTAGIFHDYHVNHNGWRALGYHFVINNGTSLPDGAIQINRARDFDHDWDLLEEVGAHAAGFNTRSIGICCVGRFDTKMPTWYQILACRTLVLYLCNRLVIPIDQVIGHREVGDYGGTPVTKSCPGSMIDMRIVRDYFAGKVAVSAHDRTWYQDLMKYYERMYPGLIFTGV